MKRVLIGILIFVLYMALVVGGAFLLHFEGTKLILFCVILGLVGALTIAFVVWYLHKASGDSAGGGGLDTPDGVNLNTLLRDADAKVRQAGRAGAKSLASLPLICNWRRKLSQDTDGVAVRAGSRADCGKHLSRR